MRAIVSVHPYIYLLHTTLFIFSALIFFPTLEAQVPDECGDVENLALGKPTSQSSLYGLGFAAIGVDGDKDGTRGPWENASLVHTQSEENPWWEVDLESIARIETIKIYNRTDCCQDRMNNFFLLFSDVPIDPEMSFNELLDAPAITALNFIEPVGDSLFLDVGTSGRYVRIQLGTANLLHFAEIEVIGCNANTCVNPPVIEVNPVDAQVCGGTGSVSLGATPDLGEFVVMDMSGNQIESLTSLDQGSYTWEHQYFGCMSQGSFTISGPPLPAVSIDPVGPFTVEMEPQQLSASPAGGVWSGPVNAQGLFDPGMGFGDYEVYYAYTDSENCTAIDTLEISVLVVLDGESPTTPSDLAIVDSGLTYLTLSWQQSTDNEGVAGYYIYRNGITPPSDTVIGDVGSFQVENLIPNTTYQFAVSAYDQSGNVSFQSQAISGKTLACGMEIVEIDVTDETSCGAQDGSIVIKATGQNLEYSIDGGTTFQEDNIFSPLNAGIYDILVREVDLEGCFLSDVVSMGAPGSPEILSTDQSVPPEGCGNSNGQIIIFASEGNWEYSIDGGDTFQTGNSFSDLGGGIFPIVVRNVIDSTCAVRDTLIFLEPANPEILSIDKVEPGNCGADVNAQGSISLEVLAANPEFSIDGGTTFQASPEFLDLSPGIYDVVVREIETPACNVREQVALENLSGPTLVAINKEDPSECDSRDGEITVLANGDSLEYSIDGGLSFQASNVFLGLKADTYPILIRKIGQNSCVLSDTVSLAGEGTLIDFSVEVENPQDCATAQGSITVLSSGNNLEYSINGGETFQASPLFSDLAVGEYFVTVKEADSAGCIISQSVVISAENGPRINDTRTQDPTACGAEDGQITIFASGTGLSYSVDGGNTFQISNIFPNLEGGTYKVVVREQSDTTCTTQRTLVLEDRFTPSISNIELMNPSLCGVPDGRVSILADGLNLEYSLDNGLTFQRSNVFPNVGDGEYVVAVRNFQQVNCVAYDTVSLDSPTKPSIETFEIVEPTCEQSNGTMDVFAMGTSLEYSIDGGITYQSSNRFTGLRSESYTVTIREENSEGCEVSEQVNIGVRDIPEIMGIEKTSTSNCNSFDGELSIEASGEQLEYSIDGGTTYGTEKEFKGLGAGTYFIFVRSGPSSECVASTISEITNPEECGLLSEGQISIRVRPNPFNNTFDLDILGNIDPEATIEIINPVGQVLEKRFLAGENFLTFGEKLSSGVYYLTIRNKLKVEIIKILKQS